MSMLTIGKLANACNVNIDTVRYYERKDIITPVERTQSGYRLYSEDSIKRLKFVRATQALGFTLKEIGELLELKTATDKDCGHIKEKANLKIAEIEGKINNLIAIKGALKEMADACPGHGKPLSECTILQHLDSTA